MLEITINVPGLKELAEAVMSMAGGEKTAAPMESTPAAVPVPTSIAQAPLASQIQAVPAVAQTAPVTTQAASTVVQITPAVAPAVVPVQQTSPAVQTAVAEYSIDDLARAAMTLMDAGRQVELQQALMGFGVDALPSLPKEQYGAFATALRGLGARI